MLYPSWVDYSPSTRPIRPASNPKSDPAMSWGWASPLSLDDFCERETPNLKWMMTGGTPMTSWKFSLIWMMTVARGVYVLGVFREMFYDGPMDVLADVFPVSRFPSYSIWGLLELRGWCLTHHIAIYSDYIPILGPFAVGHVLY